MHRRPGKLSLAEPSRERSLVLLLGMSRSGTSALTRLLSFCGGAIPLDVLPANFANPTGYWEPARAVQLNEEFLRAHGSGWDDPRLLLQPPAMSGDARNRFIADIVEFVRLGFEYRGPILLKDPRITLLFPYWAAATAALGFRTVVVHMLRNPADVAASLAARDGLSVERSYALWLKANLTGERDARGYRRAFVAYEDLMRGWETVVESTIARLGLEIAISDKARLEGAVFLRSELYHHREGAFDRELVDEDLLEWVRSTYAVLLDARNGPVDEARLDAIFAEFAESRYVLATSAASGAPPREAAS